MKMVKIAQVAHTRDVGPADADRLLNTGSWVRAYSPSLSKEARRQRRFRQRKRAEGAKLLKIWLSSKEYAALKSKLRPRETLAELLFRYGITRPKK